MRPVVIDTDLGVDDATAILVAAKHKDVDLKVFAHRSFSCLSLSHLLCQRR
jgi:hypothetical protein